MSDNQATGEDGARHFLKTQPEVWQAWVPAEVADKIRARFEEAGECVDWAENFGGREMQSSVEAVVILPSYSKVEISDDLAWKVERELGLHLVHEDEYSASSEQEWDETAQEWVGPLAWRMVPNSHDWTPEATYDEHGELLTLYSDIAEWIAYADTESDSPKMLPAGVEIPSALGWTEYNDDGRAFETGWHSGQNADPAQVAAQIRAEHGPDTPVMFKQTEASQFYGCWGAVYLDGGARCLAELFEYELCEECGQDADKHTVGPDPFGNRHAWCMVEPAEEATT